MEAKIDIKKLYQLLRGGKTQRECAQVFGVTESAVSKAKKQLKNNIVRVVGLEKAGEVVQDHIDMKSQIMKINRAINDELDSAKEEIQTADGKTVQDLREVLIKLSGEIRRQLETQLRIFEVWQDAKMVAEFQTEVLSILEEMAPGTRNEIINRLKQRGLIRAAVSID